MQLVRCLRTHKPLWREVFDDTNAAKSINPNLTEGAGCDGGGWVQTSPDDKWLYHVVIGRSPGALDSYDQGVPKMVYVLDIQKLLAAGKRTTCNIDTIPEVYDGGAEADCPRLADALELPDGTSGDGFYREATTVKRIAVSDYFVARTGVDGNHKVCIVQVAADGKLQIDTKFRDENHGTPCVYFNRTDWPHGRTGNAKPHSQLFVVAEAFVKP